MADCEGKTDADYEKPKDYIELVSSDQTWNEYGIKIVQTEPQTNSTSVANVGEPLVLRVYLDVKKDPQLCPQCLFVSAWSHIKTRDNQCGMWKEVFLPFAPEGSTPSDSVSEVRSYAYQANIVPEQVGDFKITFMVKWNHILVWSNEYGADVNIKAI